HPAAVASQVAMVDTLLEGRFLFGISQGGLLSDAEMFGNLERDRVAMFVEAIDHIIALWTEDPPYRREGKFWTLGVERTLVAESVFVADDAATARRYAKGHDGPYAHYFANLGRKLRASGRGELFKHDRAMPDAAVTLDYILDSLVIAGTVDGVVDQLLAFRE